jgi:protein TonB
MTVAVRRDGTVADIVISTPSGHKVLDQAAMNTVRLAEPFPPPPQTEERIDELLITRTWDFLPGGVSTR